MTSKKPKEQLYPVYTCCRSYSAKAMRQRFEPQDFFASRSYSWFYEPSVEEIQSMSARLYQECYEEVEEQIKIEKEKNTSPEDQTIVQTTEGEEIKKAIQIPPPAPYRKYFNQKFDPLRIQSCGCQPARNVFCEKHGFEREARRNEEMMEADRFKDEIAEANTQRLESDQQAVAEFYNK